MARMMGEKGKNVMFFLFPETHGKVVSEGSKAAIKGPGRG